MTSCLICGIKLYQFDVEDRHNRQWIADLSNRSDWWADVRLLCDPDDEIGTACPTFAYENVPFRCYITDAIARTGDLRPRSEASEIEDHPGRFEGVGCFRRLGPDGPKIIWIKRSKHPWEQRTFDGRQYLPVHQVCLDIAKKVWERSPQEAFVTDMRGLWLALAWRYCMITKCYGFKKEYAPNYVVGRADFYMKWDSWRLKLTDRKSKFRPKYALPGYSDDPLDNIPDLWGTNPLEIPELTESLLVNLRETPRHRMTNLEVRFYRLPVELQLDILDKLSFRDLPRVATGFMPQRLWLRCLKSGRLSWLWDLDIARIDEKVREPCPSGEGYEWNWELLVRQLSRGVDFGIRREAPDYWNPDAIKDEEKHAEEISGYWKTDSYYDDLEYVPPGLVNRRRIWQLAEELFVGDAIPIAGMHSMLHQCGPQFVVKDFIQLPWSKSGHVLNEPKWLPSFELKQYFRCVGGGAYIGGDVAIPLQWWQDPGGYWRYHYYYLPHENKVVEEFKASGLLHWNVKWPKAAQPEEVVEVLRKLRYPV